MVTSLVLLAITLRDSVSLLSRLYLLSSLPNLCFSALILFFLLESILKLCQLTSKTLCINGVDEWKSLTGINFYRNESLPFLLKRLLLLRAQSILQVAFSFYVSAQWLCILRLQGTQATGSLLVHEHMVGCVKRFVPLATARDI